jgi:hypothetical protein
MPIIFNNIPRHKLQYDITVPVELRPNEIVVKAAKFVHNGKKYELLEDAVYALPDSPAPYALFGFLVKNEVDEVSVLIDELLLDGTDRRYVIGDGDGLELLHKLFNASIHAHETVTKDLDVFVNRTVPHVPEEVKG